MARVHKFQEMIPAYVLDALDARERAHMHKHLQTCDICPRLIAEYSAVAELLPHAAPQFNPPPRLKARVRAATRNVRKSPRELNWFANFSRAPAFAALALVIALGALAQSFLFQNQIAQQAAQLARQREFLIALAYADVQPIHVKGTEVAPNAVGRLYRNIEESSLAVFVQDLPALPTNQVYQFWFLDVGGDRTSGGTFTVDAQGRGWLIARAPKLLKEYSGVGVTIEPTGGSLKPTGAKVLGGNF
ncbi:MAG: anti-sigma factor [Chloroflexi bacterium]|nr:anti-sigma factor [Chloroflexota bacterium]